MTLTCEFIYRDYLVRYNPPPIPNRNHDWEFAHVDYDGPGDRRIGTASSKEEAKRGVDELIADMEEVEQDFK